MERPTVTARTIEAAIRDYRRGPLRNAERELKSFADEPTIAAAIARAGIAERFTGNRMVVYDHQRRLPRSVREASRKQLLQANLQGSKSFDELLAGVSEAIGPIHGVGELTVYDTALRIGARMGLEPDRVYLHAGTRLGARRLGLKEGAESIERSDLPRALQSLSPWQVEDLLCIYKDWFGAGDRHRMHVPTEPVG